MIKVLHVINGASTGGISSLILNYYKQLDKEQVHFDFITADPILGPNGIALKKMGSKFYFIPTKSKGLWNFIKKLDEFLKLNKYDVIHVHSGYTSYVALIIAWRNQIKIRIAHAHTTGKINLSVKSWMSRIIGIILTKMSATLRLSCSNDAAIYTFGKFSIHSRTVKILKNAIDIDRFCFSNSVRKAIREKLNISSDALVIGTVGRMTSEKNQIYLIKVLSNLVKEKKNIKLIFVGDGPERKIIEKKVEKLKLNTFVLFLGERTDIHELLSGMDIFLLPSLNEGLGIAAIEASSCGLPVIVSDGVPKDLSFLKKIVYLKLNNNEKEWRDQILKLTKNKHDNRESGFRERITKNGYNIRIEAEKILKFYRK